MNESEKANLRKTLLEIHRSVLSRALADNCTSLEIEKRVREIPHFMDHTQVSIAGIKFPGDETPTY